MDSRATTATPAVPGSGQGNLARPVGRRRSLIAVAAVAFAFLVVVVTVVLARDQRPFMALTARGTFVGSVAFSPDGKALAAVNSDGHVELPPPTTGKPP